MFQLGPRVGLVEVRTCVFTGFLDRQAYIYKLRLGIRIARLDLLCRPSSCLLGLLLVPGMERSKETFNHVLCIVVTQSGAQDRVVAMDGGLAVNVSVVSFA